MIPFSEKSQFYYYLILASTLFIDQGETQTNLWEAANGPGAGPVYSLQIDSHGDIFAGTGGLDLAFPVLQIMVKAGKT